MLLPIAYQREGICFVTYPSNNILFPSQYLSCNNFGCSTKEDATEATIVRVKMIIIFLQCRVLLGTPNVMLQLLSPSYSCLEAANVYISKCM